MDVSIVTPVYNEEDNIQPLFRELHNVIDSFSRDVEVIAVDDGSHDSSSEKLEEVADKYDYLRVIILDSNYGQSRALQAGIDGSRGDIIVTIDSDMQNDPRDIPRLINELKISDKDTVSGFRRERKDSLRKKMAAQIASKMRKSLFQNGLNDYGCTLKAFEKEAAKSLSLHNGMHRYIPVLLEKEDFEVSEIEVNHRERYSGDTKYGLERLPKGFTDMIDLWMEMNYGKNLIPESQKKSEYRIESVIE